tara:strand:- start:858 stop:1751 length:894 start_codon:yes stop_codon:yes gene_type:complete
VSTFDDQFKKMGTAPGFIAALDQSGGSTPKALGLYGISDDGWSSEEEMFDVVHRMRTRIMSSPSFDGNRILGAILFENTMDREVDGQSTPGYLWEEKHIVPILKVDKGLAEEADGVQLMKPMPTLVELLEKGKRKGIFGTKMRSVIKGASNEGIAKVVAQQFDLGKQIIDYGLVPIIEPEVDINCPDKAEAEQILLREMLGALDNLTADQHVMLKLTLPEQEGFYSDCISHGNTLRVVALSGGYSRLESNTRLVANIGMVASFSRALTEGLNVGQTDGQFDSALDASIQSIFEASMA